MLKRRGTTHLLRTTVLCGAFAALALPANAAANDGADTAVGGQVAQAETPAATDQDDATPPPPAAEDDTIDEIVVTGSRIRRTEFNTASPIEIITRTESTQAGLISTAEILQSATAAAGSTQINGQFTGFLVDGGPGVQTVSLRGLGANRTLVLLNGRRIAPAGIGGSVSAPDLNTLPGNIIQRQEILKDGASSIYGSDAVAGVINNITRTNLDGWELTAQTRLPQHGGGEEYLASVAWGSTFDRGNILASVEYNEQKPLLWRDRDWSKCPQQYYFDPRTGDRIDVIDPETGEFKCQASTFFGFVQLFGPFRFDSTTYPGQTLINWRFIRPGQQAGSLIPGYENLPYAGFGPDYERDPATGQIVIAPDGFPNIIDQNLIYGLPAFDPEMEGREMMISPVERYNAVLIGNYDLGFAEAYTELLYNHRKSNQYFVGQLVTTFGATNPFNPRRPGAGSLLPPGTVRTWVPLNYYRDQEVNYYRGVGGLRGELGGSGFLEGWNWDAYYQYSHSEAENNGNYLLRDRYLNSLAVTTNASGQVVCASAAARAAGCVPYNPFNNDAIRRGQFDQAWYDYAWADETAETTFTSHLVNGTMSGDLFDLPAGTVATAIGFEVRWDEIDDQPGPNSVISNYQGFSSAVPTVGKESVREIFGEVEIPLLAKKAFAEQLTFNTSARYTDYDKTGYNDLTYKFSLDWAITEEYRLRGTHGTSFRGPSLAELFLGDLVGFYSGSDPCELWEELPSTSTRRQNCEADGVPQGWTGFTSTPRIITSGNDGSLSAETSDSYTAGIVWTPSFADLSIAVDYYNIEINDQISSLSAGQLLGLCYGDRDFRSPGTFCDFVGPRNADNNIETINSSFFNINSQKISGLDITLRYEHEFDFGTMTINWDTTRSFDDDVQLFDGEEDENNGRLGQPLWVSRFDASFERGDWEFFWQTRYFSEQTNFRSDVPFPNNSPQTSFYDLTIDDYFVHTASLTWETDVWSVRGGVSNIFDKDPDYVSDATVRLGNAYAFNTSQELRGRTFFLTVQRLFD